MIDTQTERAWHEQQIEVCGTLKQDIVIEFLAPERYADLPKGMLVKGHVMRGFFYFEIDGRPARLPERFIERHLEGWKPARGNRFQPGHGINRGERHGMAKLSAKQVKEIRRELRNGATVGQLAIKYRVSGSTISAIKRRKIWTTI